MQKILIGNPFYIIHFIASSEGWMSDFEKERCFTLRTVIPIEGGALAGDSGTKNTENILIC